MNKVLMLAAAGAALASASHAAPFTVSNSARFGPMITDFNISGLTLQPFNTSLGTLNSVTLSMTGNASVGGSVQNNSTSPQSFNITTDTTVTLSSATVSVSNLTLDLIARQAYTLVPGGGMAVYGPFTPSASAANVAGTPLSDYTAGPINFTASTSSATTIRGGGNNIAATVNSTAGGTVTVTYDYTPTPPATVPEPASMALLGVGLAGLGLIRRRSV